MAVLVEAISVVIRADVLLAAFERDWEAFKAEVPNGTLCADGELVRVGFMVPDDVRTFVEHLASRRLVFQEDGKARDLVVVDQQRGPTVPCGWLEFGHVNLDSDPRKRIACCRLAGNEGQAVATPDGWTFENSLSRSFGFTPKEEVERNLDLLWREDGMEAHRNRLTGKEVFAARRGSGDSA